MILFSTLLGDEWKDELISDILLRDLHMDVPVLTDQQEFIYISSVQIQDVIGRRARGDG